MKRLPFLTQSQRRALLVLEWVLLIVLMVLALRTPSNSPVKGEGRPSKSPLKEDSLSLSLREGRGGAGWVGSVPEEQPFETFPFDPNTADSTTLLRLGLSPWQVRSIYRYRAKHGRYHTPEDFMRVPNMTNEQWERLKDYIQIDHRFQYVEPQPREAKSRQTEAPAEHVVAQAEEARQDSFPKQEKIQAGQTIDINTADTTLLKQIPGIASRRAARIVRYREELGGFVAVEQAMEAAEMPDSVLRYMNVSAQPVRRININKASVQQMMRHPYLSFYQAKAINEHRRNKGELHSLEELSRLEGFKPTDIDRLRPYVEF